ncbi:hypothetical protein [Amycolatopsis sp.]|uniref:hypothetical protein n=1 Tax=Amycolatopsis sp. TaxID=37632 RepID=UPI002C7F027C|nr:hypothetical protein [Amycolatopsis sp.]HVV14054.1 hypothetical protein [Amycolatopsis sp.]
MSRTLLRVLAWVAATALGMGMSWFGVHAVLSADTSDAAPQAITVETPVPETTSASPPSTTTTVPPPSSSRRTSSSETTTPPTTSPAADVRSVQLTGGRVVLQLTETDAKLVSATPEPGWQVQAWQADGWLRVDFSRDSTTSSCFVTWNGHPPAIQTT